MARRLRRKSPAAVPVEEKFSIAKSGPGTREEKASVGNGGKQGAEIAVDPDSEAVLQNEFNDRHRAFRRRIFLICVVIVVMLLLAGNEILFWVFVEFAKDPVNMRGLRDAHI